MRTTLFSILILVLADKIVCQNLFPFRQNDKWFYVDSSFKKHSDKTYSFIFPFNRPHAIVRQNDKYGAIDKKENILIPCVYDTIIYSNLDFYCVQNKVETFIDKNGKEFKPVYGACGGSVGTERAFYTYTKNNKVGVLKYNQARNRFDSLPNIYKVVTEYYTGIAFAKKGDKWGTINSSGKIITDFVLDSVIITDCSSIEPHVLNQYVSDNKVGFINTSGKIITKAKYTDIYFNFGQLTLVKTPDDKLVYIDSKGREYYK